MNPLLLEEYGALLGEISWHSLVNDPRIDEVSKEHYNLIMDIVKKYNESADISRLKILEIGSYAHFTGYKLQKQGADVTLFDISTNSIELGRQIAKDKGLYDNKNKPRLVVGNFHEIPFDENSFDLVFICSALHHTWDYQTVVREMLRVLSSDGLLLLEQEPCKRAACFYKFRTNRLDSMTRFEKKLNEIGILKTFAEPYLGSRPETLFGMIENQQIPLQELLNTIKSNANIIELVLGIEVMMGNIENEWLKHRYESARKLAKIIEMSLLEKRVIAIPYLSEKDVGLGFDLPSPREIKELSFKVASLISQLPNTHETGYRPALAEIFGSPVRLIARKKSGLPRGSGRIVHACEQRNGLYFCLPEKIKKIIFKEPIIPNIQTSDMETLSQIFPKTFWSHYKDKNTNIVSLWSNSLGSEVVIPAGGEKRLVILRFYVVEDKHCGYRLSIKHEHDQLFSFDVWQSESFLFSQIVEPKSNNNDIVLKIEIEPIGYASDKSQVEGRYAVSVALAYDIE